MKRRTLEVYILPLYASILTDIFQGGGELIAVVFYQVVWGDVNSAMYFIMLSSWLSSWDKGWEKPFIFNTHHYTLGHMAPLRKYPWQVTLIS
jgi:hypothetical protein